MGWFERINITISLVMGLVLEVWAIFVLIIFANPIIKRGGIKDRSDWVGILIAFGMYFVGRLFYEDSLERKYKTKDE